MDLIDKARELIGDGGIDGLADKAGELSDIAQGEGSVFEKAQETLESVEGEAGDGPGGESGGSKLTAAVVFDLDGLLLDSETAWDAARRELVRGRGGTWTVSATRDMMGMSSPEWSRYLAEELGVDLPPEEISDLVLARVLASYREELPAGAGSRRGSRGRLLALTAGPRLLLEPEAIDLVLDLSGLRPVFRGRDLVGGGSSRRPRPTSTSRPPARLRSRRPRAWPIEDSENGIRSANAAGMRVIAVPNAGSHPRRKRSRSRTAFSGRSPSSALIWSRARPLDRRRAGARPLGCRGAGRSGTAGIGRLTASSPATVSASP